MTSARRRFLAATLSAALLGFAASPALAGTLDQSQTSGSDSADGIGTGLDQSTGQGGTLQQGQTFTAGPSGALDQADLYLERNCTSPGSDVSVQVRTVSGNPAVPTSTALATASVPAASVPSSPGWVTVLFATPAPVSAGTHYALVAAASGATCPVSPSLWATGYFWGFTFQDLYGGGTRVSSLNGGAWSSQGGGDFAFKTYVIPDTAPTANAGPDQTVNGGSLVTLDGTGSSDPQGEALTYAWTTTETGVTLSDPSSPTPTFTAPEVSADRPLTFALEVCDEPNPDSLCDTDTVMVNVKAPPPPPAGDPGAGSTGDTGTGTGTGTTTATGLRAAALERCKKKRGAARRKCKRRASRLPI
jgi:hypothetical protein